MSIQEFLLARIDQDEDETAICTATHGGPDVGPQIARTTTAFRDLRSVVYGHRERSMRVTSVQGVEIMTHCGVCVTEKRRPCLVLRTLAQPYKDHPRYDDAWDLDAA